MSDINVVIETEPELTSIQVRQLLDEMGDEYYHDLIEWATAGGEAGATAPSHMTISVKEREPGDSGYPDNEDRIKGMVVETDFYLDKVLQDRGIVTTHFTVERIPDGPSKTEMHNL